MDVECQTVISLCDCLLLGFSVLYYQCNFRDDDCDELNPNAVNRLACKNVLCQNLFNKTIKTDCDP